MNKLKIFIFSLLALTTTDAQQINPRCERIVSISPTITDMLFSVGLHDHIVGGTRYDRLPIDSKVQVIGGTLDPNYEAIIMLAPTIIMADLTEDSPQMRKLHSLQLPTEILNYSTVKELQTSLQQVGEICNIKARTTQKIAEIDQVIAETKIDNAKLNVLIMYTYEGDDHLRKLPQRAAGKSFHQDMLTALGIKNAYQGAINAPIMSSENILALNPNIIILLEGDQKVHLDSERTITIDKVIPQWPHLQSLSAIQNNEVYFVKGEATFIASPDAIIATLKSWSSIFKAYEASKNLQ